MSHTTPDWQYDETKQVGMDYSADAVANEYDTNHSVFRDYDREVESVIDALELNSDSTVLDIGCGTDPYSLRLARHCKQVYAVDVSKSMLSIAHTHAREQKLSNISFVNAGFLTYQHNGNALDAVISALALHHLPDFWKLIALKRLYAMLKPGGRFFLVDVVFCFPADDYHNGIKQWLRTMETVAGSTIMRENSIHIREEFSTWDWIMRDMLLRAGFEIRDEASPLENVKGYVCVKAERDAIP